MSNPLPCLTPKENKNIKNISKISAKNEWGAERIPEISTEIGERIGNTMAKQDLPRDAPQLESWDGWH